MTRQGYSFTGFNRDRVYIEITHLRNVFYLFAVTTTINTIVKPYSRLSTARGPCMPVQHFVNPWDYVRGGLSVLHLSAGFCPERFCPGKGVMTEGIMSGGLCPGEIFSVSHLSSGFN